jgi:hypothetical protein
MIPLPKYFTYLLIYLSLCTVLLYLQIYCLRLSRLLLRPRRHPIHSPSSPSTPSTIVILKRIESSPEPHLLKPLIVYEEPLVLYPLIILILVPLPEDLEIELS